MADDPEILYWCEMAEAIAWREMMAAVQESGNTSLGAQWIEVGGAVAFTLAALDQAFFNRAVGLGIARQATLADVAQIDEFYRGMGQQWSVVHVAQGAQPPELVEWIEAAGWALSRRWPKLWRTLDGDLPPETTDLRIERVGPDRAADFARIVSSAFDLAEPAAVLGTAPMGRTGWSHYLGYDGDMAVSAAASFVTADVAWLGWGATLESHRGRGGQSAMFARRLADARTAGCRLAITETGEDTPEAPNPSYRNMLWAGFEVAYVRPNWVRRPPDDQP